MLDHEAIRKAYPDAVTIDDGAGAFKADGSQKHLFNLILMLQELHWMLIMQK